MVLKRLLLSIFLTAFTPNWASSSTDLECAALFSKMDSANEKLVRGQLTLGNSFAQKSNEENFAQFKSMTTQEGQSLASLYQASAGVSEGYTVEEHTAMVLQEMTDQWPIFKVIFNTSMIEKFGLENLLRFSIFLHDIGKPLAIAKGNKNLQHQFTIPILKEMAEVFHLSEEQKSLALSLVGNDVLGEFVTGKIGLDETMQVLKSLASTNQLSLQVYFKLQLFFYTVDAASYPVLKKNIFFKNSEKMLVLVSSRARELELAINGQELNRKNLGLKTQSRQLLKNAKNLMQRQRDLLDKLINTSGYQSLDKIKSAFIISPENKTIAQFMAEPHTYLQFVINRPSEARDSVAVAGFRNIYQTGLTQGGSSFDGSIEMRAAVEASMLNLSVEKYKALGPELMAQFGYLRANPQLTGMRPPLVGYGDDVWIFKQSHLENFASISAGDSLNRWRDNESQDAVLSRSRVGGELKSWDQLFVPWSHRALVLPFITLMTSENRGNQSTVLTASTSPSIPMNETAFPMTGEYLELQFWRPLSLDDVESFEFRTYRPTGKFLAELRAHHIKIYDGRLDENIREWIYDGQKLQPNPDWPPKKLWPPKIWNEDSN